MRSERWMLILVTGLLLALAVPLYAQSEALTIGLSVPSDAGAYYEVLVSNAVETAERLGVGLTVVSAQYSAETELLNVTALIEQAVDLLLLAPASPVESQAAIEAANKAGIPVILLGGEIEPVAEGSDFQLEVAGVIATDYAAEGELAAAVACRMLDGSGGLVEVISYAVDAEAALPEPLVVLQARTRSESFAAALAAICAGVTVVPVEVAGLDDAGAAAALAGALRAQRVNAILTYDDAAIFAALEAAQQTRSRAIKMIGFGASQELIGAVEQGSVEAAVVPLPHGLGQLGIETALAYLNGEPVAAGFEIELAVLDANFLTIMRSCGSWGEPPCPRG